MKNYPTVSITFPVYNGGKEPIECLNSIVNLNYPKNKIEIVIVDNNSSDGSDKIIKQKFPQVRLIKMKENVGFAKGVNIGIKHSSGAYIFIGNDDIVFEKNSLKNMIEYMEQHPEVGITGGKIFLKSKPNKIISPGFMMNTWTGKIYPAPLPEIAKEPNWVQGCAMLVPRKVFKKIGLLDEGFSLAYFEDFDYCLRAKKAGFSIRYLPDAIFWHGETTTGNKNIQRKYYYWYKNKIRFTLKNLSLFHMLSILSIQLLIITPYRFFVLRDGRFIPLIKGLSWNIYHISQTLSERNRLLYKVT